MLKRVRDFSLEISYFALQLSGNFVVKDLTADQHHSHLPAIVMPVGTRNAETGNSRSVVLASSGCSTVVVTIGPGATLSNASGCAVSANVQIGVVTYPASLSALSTYRLMLMSLMLGSLSLCCQRPNRTTF